MVNAPDVVKSLVEMADDYDARAERLERGGQAKGPEG